MNERKEQMMSAVQAAVGGTLIFWVLVQLYGSSLGPTQNEIEKSAYTRCLEYASQGVLHLHNDSGRWWDNDDDWPSVCQIEAYESSDNPKLGTEVERDLYEALSPFDQWAKATRSFLYFRPKVRPQKPADAWVLQVILILAVFWFEQRRSR